MLLKMKQEDQRGEGGYEGQEYLEKNNAKKYALMKYHYDDEF